METNPGLELISIIGMHRSGTSALAGALHKLGADLGPESSWLGPAADNPHGFFEYAPVVDIDRKILAALGGTWSSPPPLPPAWVEDDHLSELRDQATELAKEMPSRMVVKDPRLSLVQPLWEEVTTVPASILCIRHPIAVSKSLRKRNGLTVDQSLFLWFRYSAAAALNCRDALVVEYEALLEDPVAQLTGVSDHIGLEVSEKTLEAASRTVYRSMAHHQGEELPETPIGIVCRRLYDLVRSGEALEADQFVSIWAHLATDLPWTGPAERAMRQIRHEVTELKLENERLTHGNKEKERRLRRLATELRNASIAGDAVSIAEVADLLRSQVNDAR